jgi:uncharacterized membrane protein YczE
MKMFKTFVLQEFAGYDKPRSFAQHWFRWLLVISVVLTALSLVVHLIGLGGILFAVLLGIPLAFLSRSVDKADYKENAWRNTKRTED